MQLPNSDSSINMSIPNFHQMSIPSILRKDQINLLRHIIRQTLTNQNEVAYQAGLEVTL